MSSSAPNFSSLSPKWRACCGAKIKLLLCFLRQSEERLRHEQQDFGKLGWILRSHLSWESDHTGRQRTDPSSLLGLGPVSLVCISTIPAYVKYSAVQTGGQPSCQQPEEIKIRWSLLSLSRPTPGSTAWRVDLLGSEASFWVGLAMREGTGKLIHGWAMTCTEEDHSDHLGSVPVNREISTIVRTLSECPHSLGPSSQSGGHENMVVFFFISVFFFFCLLLRVQYFNASGNLNWTNQQWVLLTAVSQWYSAAHFDTFRAQNIFGLCHTANGLGLSNKVDVFIIF